VTHKHTKEEERRGIDRKGRRMAVMEVRLCCGRGFVDRRLAWSHEDFGHTNGVTLALREERRRHSRSGGAWVGGWVEKKETYPVLRMQGNGALRKELP
jgi:hypothetical protein